MRGAGLYSIGRDGEDMRTLINFRGKNMETGTMIKARSLDPYAYTFGSTLHDGSGDIVVYHWKKSETLYTYGSEWTGTTPVRMNARTGALSDMGSKWPEHVTHWTIDSLGQVRAGVQELDGQTTLLTPDVSGPWKERARFPTYEHSPEAIDLDGVGADGLAYASKLDRATGARHTRPLRHLFLFIGAEPNTGWLSGCEVSVDAKGFICTGEGAGPDRALLETSRKGVFAIGDVRAGSVKRVAAVHAFLGASDPMAAPAPHT